MSIADIHSDWPTCEQDECNGIRLSRGRKCLAHSTDQQKNSVLQKLSQTGQIDVRGTTISEKLSTRILASAQRDEDGQTVFDTSRFDAAIFEGDIDFEQVIFKRAARFRSAIFRGEANFGRVHFGAIADFTGATFEQSTWFDEAVFHKNALFSGAKFLGTEAYFGNATFQGRSFFTEANFLSASGFIEVIFRYNAQFDEVVFERAEQFGPILAYRGLDLDGIQFSQPVEIEVSSMGFCCRRARFKGGAQFLLRWSCIVLDDTDFFAPSLLNGVPLVSDWMVQVEPNIARAWARLLGGGKPEQPKLLSLQRAKVAQLGLGNVDLSHCRFAGAHGLDKMRLEADAAFGISPSRLSWERRQVIAEECAWRANQTSPGQWTVPPWPGWAGRGKPAILDPGTIAGLYRALRKGREDAKDEPGAADFYYGEMEMRRHAYGEAGAGGTASRGRADRGVLTAYWLISGYGLRAWRSFGFFVGTIVIVAFALHLVGFVEPPKPASYWTSLLYAFRSTISLSDNAVTLTPWGQLLQALLRLTGPVLFALAILALRGRTKR